MRKNTKLQIPAAPIRPASDTRFPISSTWVGSWMSVLGYSTQTQPAQPQKHVQSETSPEENLQQVTSEIGISQRNSDLKYTSAPRRGRKLSEPTDKIAFFPSSMALHESPRQFDVALGDSSNAQEDLASDRPSADASAAFDLTNEEQATSTAERRGQFADLWIALFEFERLTRSNKEERNAA